MKTLTQLFVLTVLCLMISSAAAGQSANGCSSGMRNGIYYTDCWTDVSDDTTRLQAAIDYASGSAKKLVFNEGTYYTTDTLVLHSDLTIEGMGGSGVVGPSTIHMWVTATGESVFYIGAGVQHVAIRDLGFYDEAGPVNGNNGIMAEGYSIGSTPALHLSFDNLKFQGFAKGFYANSPGGGWQMDNVQLSNTFFDGCDTAIHLASDNANMEIHNVDISSGSGQNGIDIERAGYVIMTYIIGNAIVAEKDPPAGFFISIVRHAPINMNSVFAEGPYHQMLYVSGFSGYKFVPITITNSAFPACRGDEDDVSDPAVLFNHAVVVSSGNYWQCGDGLAARPVVTGDSDITSTGDRFCVPLESTGCTDMAGNKGGFLMNSNDATLRSDNSLNPADLTTPFVNILAGVTLVSRPLLALTLNDFTNTRQYSYTFKVDNTNHRLVMENAITSPSPSPTPASNTGYYFKGGPVQLQTATAGTLSSYNASSDTGSMLYCSDCAIGSTPCTGSSSGALAIKMASQWSCK